VFGDLGSIAYGVPAYRWLLVLPAALLGLWAWRATRRLIELRRLRERRVVPIRERWSLLGDLPAWLCIVLACAGLVVALARPRGVAPRLGRTGLDVVVLQDGSASMYVRDVPGGGTRWARSMTFVRRLGDALRWDDDRLALTVFARIATPQVRLTRDPNTVFFFLDHLGDRPPFALADETTWDTNVEQGIGWGLRVLAKDREIQGPSANAPLFILVSDGETWSGEVARAVDRIRDANVPLFVVGVGSLAGGRMPALPFPDDGDPPPTVSRLDRPGLQRLALEGRGVYFELDRDPDRDIANRVIDAGRRSAAPTVEDAVVTDLYWPLVAAACALAGIGVLFVRRRSALWLQLAGAAIALVVSLRVLW
jgi:Ca-activated chloride channel family protein